MVTGDGTAREGSVLKDKYRLDELLGEGGMAHVYRATNTHVDRTVAIKLLRVEFASNALVLERFMREAKAANAVSHRNIVDVLDIDKDDSGAMFIVEEYLEGEDLAARVTDGGSLLSPGELLDLLVPIAEAVGLAHDKGIVHRDLKPENIFLAFDGDEIVPKVLDFGISKVPLQAAEVHNIMDASSHKPKSHRLTAVGGAMGTPSYMPPEQIKDSASADARSDVWALGVIMYESLTGELPFVAETLGGLFAEICTREPPRVDRLVEGVPSCLARAVHRCLSPDPGARYDDANRLCEELTGCRERMAASDGLAQEPISSMPPAERSRPAAGLAATDPATAPSAAGALELEAPRAEPRKQDTGPNPNDWELDIPTGSLPPPSGPGGLPSIRPARASAPAPGVGNNPFGIFDEDSTPSLDLQLEDERPQAQRPAPSSKPDAKAHWSVPPSVERSLRSSSDAPPARGTASLSPEAAASHPPAAVASRPLVSTPSRAPAPAGSRAPLSSAPSSRAPLSSAPSSRAPRSRSSPLPPGPDSFAPGSRPSPAPSRPASLLPDAAQSLRPDRAQSLAPDSPRQQRRRGIQLTGRAAVPHLTLAGDLGRILAAISLAVVAALLGSALSPRGLVQLGQQIGPGASLMLGIGALLILPVTAWLALHAFRWMLFSLLPAVLGLLTLAASAGITALVLGAPGIVSTTWRAAALVAAPWAAAISALSLALYTALRAKELRASKHPQPWLPWAFIAAAVAGCAATGWIAIGPHATIEEVTQMPACPAEPKAVGQVRHFAIILAGQRRLRAEPAAQSVEPLTALPKLRPASGD